MSLIASYCISLRLVALCCALWRPIAPCCAFLCLIAAFCAFVHLFAFFCALFRLFAPYCALLRLIAPYCAFVRLCAPFCAFLRLFAPFCAFCAFCAFLRLFAARPHPPPKAYPGARPAAGRPRSAGRAKKPRARRAAGRRPGEARKRGGHIVPYRVLLRLIASLRLMAAEAGDCGPRPWTREGGGNATSPAASRAAALSCGEPQQTATSRNELRRAATYRNRP